MVFICGILKKIDLKIYVLNIYFKTKVVDGIFG
jgi:hypothetical protein